MAEIKEIYLVNDLKIRVILYTYVSLPPSIPFLPPFPPSFPSVQKINEIINVYIKELFKLLTSEFFM